jgi:hypothetical protein
LSRGENSVNRITQVLWTGSPSVTRVASCVFFGGSDFQSVRATQGRIDNPSHGFSFGSIALEQATLATRSFIDFKQNPRHSASDHAERAGVFPFLGGA